MRGLCTASAIARRAIRPRRSALYLPGSNARALEKARTLPTDVLILDLEDAVAPDKKPLARSSVAEALEQHRMAGTFGRRELVVRVNSLHASRWGCDDVRACGPIADAILLPKAESVEEVAAVREELRRAGVAADAEPAIWCMIETPLGVLRAESLAAAPEVECLVAGTNDLATDLQCDGAWAERAALLPALSLTVLAARAHGKACLDGVHIDLKDLAGLERACVQGRALGFDGKTLIHPSTLEPANRIFAPSAEAAAHATSVIAAFDAAKAEGSALAVLNGKLVEELHVRAAERTLAMVAAIEEQARGADLRP